MGTAVKHPVSDRVKPAFVIFDIRALWHSDVKNYKWRQPGLAACFIAVPYGNGVLQTVVLWGRNPSESQPQYFSIGLVAKRTWIDAMKLQQQVWPVIPDVFIACVTSSRQCYCCSAVYSGETGG